MTRKLCRVAVGIPFLFLPCIPALSQTPCAPTGTGVCRYVSATGSDSNNGLTRTTPKQTIATTVNASSPGDEIIVLAGTYNCTNQTVSPCTGGENSPSILVNITASGTSANPIVVVCDSYLGCKLDGTNGGGTATARTAEALTFAGSYISVRNFEIEGYTDLGLDNYKGGTNLVWDRNWVHDIGRYCTTTGIGRDGMFVSHSNVTITQNIISDIGRYAVGENGCAASLPYKDHGIYNDYGADNVFIANNIFYRVERGYSVQLYNGTWNNFSILNNTFVWGDPNTTGFIVFDVVAVNNLLIENNNFYQPYGNALIKYNTGTSTGSIANNIIYGAANVMNTTSSGFNATITGNVLNTDPKLVSVGSSVMDNPSVPDAHLTLGSPAIKAGLTLAAVPDDFGGALRIPGAYDMGAYAFTTSTSAPVTPTNLKVVAVQ